MNFIVDNKEWLIGIFTTVFAWFGGLKLKKVFEGRDKISANDESFSILKKRIDDLTDDYIGLNQRFSEVQKEVFEKTNCISELEFEVKKIRGLISRTCINKCLKDE
jgi:archaellum component FlaC